MSSELKPKKERVRKEVARKHNLPERKVRYAQEVERAAPELAKKVLDGEMPLLAARREVKAHAESGPQPLAAETTLRPHRNRRMTPKKYNGILRRVFMELFPGISSGLDMLDLEAGPLDLSAQDTEKCLETGRTLEKQLGVILPRLQSRAGAARVCAEESAETVTVKA